ncbi:MAG: hypothetical protein COT34_01075 [Candidatus Nealsonbacteria bacterium CG08_land_8_20_14_0_20_43_11]|uniref:SCP domain-containing protein n=1 Tax=Candidatus Nealsonbacteria bacterium CG08_land_8_20_14_0_20_43_11 TaxID=1974706 RepID=A0A2M6T185_9BACT|nr:MAG: hypothetical protein COT34_01075 [Candidatus Nealsonbacteria bacterium CG08_land_8_20_14_0_20_43_11]
MNFGQIAAKKAEYLFVPCLENHFRPRFLDGRFLIYYLAVLVFLRLVSFSSLIYLPRTIFFADISNYVLTELTNKDRQALGLAVLKENPLLDQAAYQKAKDMLEKGYFSHKSPEGKSSWQWIKEVNYDYQYAGENLAIGFLDSEEVYQAWFSSPTHKTNLLNPRYSEIGIAVLKGDFQGSETYVVVQLFGTQKEKPIVLTETAYPPPREPTGTPLALPTISPTPENQLAETPVPSEIPSVSQTPPESAVKGEALFSGNAEAKHNFLFKLSRFLATNYNDFVQLTILFSLLVVTLSLLINVFVRFDIQFNDLLARASIFIIILVLFAVFDKNLLIHLIPHQTSIY